MMRRVVSLWLPRFATDRIERNRRGWRDSAVLQDASLRAAPQDERLRESRKHISVRPEEALLGTRGAVSKGEESARKKSRQDGRDDIPLVTVREARGRLELAAANGAAEAAGLGAGMALADARAILPSVETVAADPGGDRALLDRLVSWCGRYGPWAGADDSAPVSVIGGDAGIRLDITGCAHLFGGEAMLLADLTADVAALGFSCRATLTDTPGAAWAMARYGAFGDPPWSVVPAGKTRAGLEKLPVAALRLCPDDVAGLEALGLRHIGDLLPLPRAALAARFGEGIAQRLDQALGRRPETLSPAPPVEPYFARMAFPDPIGRVEDIADALDSLLHHLCARLARDQRGARRLVLTLCEPDGNARRIAVGAGRPGRDPDHLARLFAEHLDGVEAAFGIDALTLHAPVTEAMEQSQTSLTAGNGLSRYRDEVDRLTDRLSNRLGAASVLRLAPRESHIPERAVREMSVLGQAGEKPPVPPQQWPHHRPCAQPRPPRLFPHPELIEAVAPVPDDPPVLFRWRRMTFRVARAEGPERLAPEWWLSDPDRLRDQDGDIRDYYRVEDTDGRRFWLYRQGLYRPGRTAEWYLHGVGG